MDPDALKVLYRLNRAGHRAFLVGGGVRDLLVGRRPKDFDIATDATPRRIKNLFRNCRLIGRRFRLAHLHYPGDKIIEVATFRSSPDADAIERDGELIQRDNVFGTPKEDARRRDLTINGLFYSVEDFSIIDYVGGVKDLEDGVIRMIRDPIASFREDPVRMLRAIRHGTRLGFDIEEETRKALHSERDEILKANPARLLEEFYKDLSGGCAREYFQTLHDYKFMQVLVPALAASFRKRGARAGKALFFDTLERLDDLYHAKQPITHAQSLAAFFSPLILPVTKVVEEFEDESHAVPEPFQEALQPALENLKIYRRDAERLWHILGAWPRLAKGFERGHLPRALTRRQYFRDAIEVFGLLNEPSPELDEFLEYGRGEIPPEDEQIPDPQEKGRRRRGPRRGRGRGNSGGRRPAEKGGDAKGDSDSGGRKKAGRKKSSGTAKSSGSRSKKKSAKKSGKKSGGRRR